ncbi:unnamed protein product, partial [Rangifer tarandus platyrhynchus]
PRPLPTPTPTPTPGVACTTSATCPWPLSPHRAHSLRSPAFQPAALAGSRGVPTLGSPRPQGPRGGGGGWGWGWGGRDTQTPAADLGCLRAAREPLRFRLPKNQMTFRSPSGAAPRPSPTRNPRPRLGCAGGPEEAQRPAGGSEARGRRAAAGPEARDLRGNLALGGPGSRRARRGGCWQGVMVCGAGAASAGRSPVAGRPAQVERAG